MDMTIDDTWLHGPVLTCQNNLRFTSPPMTNAYHKIQLESHWAASSNYQFIANTKGQKNMKNHLIGFFKFLFWCSKHLFKIYLIALLLSGIRVWYFPKAYWEEGVFMPHYLNSDCSNGLFFCWPFVHLNLLPRAADCLCELPVLLHPSPSPQGSFHFTVHWETKCQLFQNF